MKTIKMNSQEEWRLENATAEKYEELFVPALFAAWAVKLINVVRLSQEKNILDVACGTGIVARTVKDQLKDKATVTGIDLNPAMLRVARRIESDINWVEGDAQRLPFENESFDAVLCQAALMFFPDKVAALSEMNRVSQKGGKIAVQVWGQNEAYDILTDILEEVSGSETAAIMRAPFILEDTTLLADLFEKSGIPLTDLQTDQTILKAPSLEQWLQIELESWALSGKVDAATILPKAKERLQNFCTADGTIEIPMRGHIAVAVKS
ncbi:MAG: methyltransferase domain-containing protein [Bacteroidota bacterium]|nr:methyltransferase domain-containing protein [Bacteroidota bacterium]